MKKKKIFRFILILFLFFPNLSSSEGVKIKYIVENTTITNVDIRNEINYLLLVNNQLSELQKDLLVEYSIKSILREKIKEIELRKNYSFNENDKIINDQILSFRNKLKINDDESFQKLLDDLNLSRSFIYRKIEIEILWNKLIYERFINQVYVDQEKIKNDLLSKLENSQEETIEYLLYEILFSANEKKELNLLYDEIKNSISRIGFENTASVLSISDTSKFGGRIGWVSENQLSIPILKKIKNLEKLKESDPINTPNGILILMVKDQRSIKKKVSFDEELQKMINNEAEKQLDQFSQIFFKKIELNTKIYEK